MKAVRTAAMVVGAVALVVATAGAAGFIGAGAIGAGFGASSIATVGLSSTLFGVSASTMLLGSAAVLAATGMKKPAAIGGGSQTEFSADPRSGVPYAMGRTGTKGSIVLRRSADGWSNDTPNDLMDIVSLLSGAGPIEANESFSSDKVAVAFDGAGNATGNLANYMFQKTQLGACPEAAALTVTAGISTHPTGWTSAHKLSGMAAAIWRLRYDAKQEFYQNGVPDPLWVIKGVRVYDPRQDSTFPGGSGPCRWDDESTWVWDGIDPEYPAGENPILHGLTWCLGRHQNGRRVMGLGARLDQLVTEQFAEAATIADINGWKISGVIYSRPDTKWNNLKLILQAGAAEPVQIGARIGCRVKTPRVSLATITRADVIGDAQLATTQSKRVRINTVIPRYRSEAHGWEVVPGAAIAVASHIAEDGDERTREIEYPLVPDTDQAAVLARYDIEESREFGPGTFPLKPKWIGYKPGDCLSLDFDDIEDQKILVLQRDIDAAGARVTFTVQSETDAKHPFSLGQTGVAPALPSVSAYDPTVAAPALADWSLTGTSVLANGTSQPALEVIGEAGSGYADAVVWDYRPYDAGAGAEDDWIAAGVDSPQVRRKVFTGIAPGTEYEVSVRYRSRGVTGARRVLGPATAGAWGSGVRKVVTRSVNYPVSSDDDSISIAAFDGVLDNGVAISFPADTLSGLAAGTNYAVLWNLSTEAYAAVEAPASTEMASPEFAFLGWQLTSDEGEFPASEPPPPGFCVSDDTPVLLADGTQVPAAELVPGIAVRTQHERTMTWGDWPILAVSFVERPVFACDLEGLDGPVMVRATGQHRFLINGRWVAAETIGTPAGMARVAKITVAEAHTYVSAGVLSHNVKVDYFI